MTRQTPTAVTTPVVGRSTVTRQTPTAVTTPVVGGHTSDTTNTNSRDDTGGWWSHE